MKTRQISSLIGFLALSVGLATPASAGWYYVNNEPAFDVPVGVDDLPAEADLGTSDVLDLGADDVLNSDSGTDGISPEPEFLTFAPLAFGPSNEDAIQVTQVEQVPEPVTLALLGLGLAGLGFSLRKRL